MDEFFKEDKNTLNAPLKASTTTMSSNTIMFNKELQPTSPSSPHNDTSAEGKAIPGGRYGCAQFIKICGPSILKDLSIGKLTLFIQEAINRGFLKYERTLLVKNKNPSEVILNALSEGNNMNQDPAIAKKARLVKKVKEAIIDILLESLDGVSFA